MHIQENQTGRAAKIFKESVIPLKFMGLFSESPIREAYEVIFKD